MNPKSLYLFNVRLDNLTDKELIQILENWLQGQEQKMIVTPNPEFLLLARQNKEFQQALAQADLCLPDGVGLRFAAAALTDTYLQNRHTGVDVVEILAFLCEKFQNNMLLFGGFQGTEKQAAEKLQEKFPKLLIRTIDPGIFSENKDPNIILQIQETKPDVLIVALGGKNGKQEKFLAAYRKDFPNVKILIGVGGALDMIAGKFPRAPVWMRKSGLEWIWRFMIQPGRWKRIFRASVVFPILVGLITIQQHRFFIACKRVFPEIYKQIFRK